MKARFLLIIFFSIAGYLFSQTEYPLVTIQDIQRPPDSLIGKTDPPSVINGDTVRVRGVILVQPIVHPDTNRGTIISAGGRWATYIQDPDGGLWGGLNVLQNDTIDIHQQTFFDLVDTAMVVEFTGVVTEFFTTTELMMLIDPQPVPVQIIEQKDARPDPIEITLADLFTENGGYNFDAEKYENMYVIFKNVSTSNRNPSSGGASIFRIDDRNGHSAAIYSQSRYFKTGSTGILPNYQPPQDGTFLSYLRGIVTTRTDGYWIVPMYPDDVGPATSSPPVISSIRRNLPLVGPNQPVEISASIRDLDGNVTEAKLFFSINGGDDDSLSMTSSLTDPLIYTTTIPGIPDSAIVSYYVRATDDEGNTSINPSNTVTGRYFYMVLDRPITIQDAQYSPFGSGYSAFYNYRVQLQGVVTADTSDLPGISGTPLRVYMQNGEGPWSGIQIGTLGVLGTNVLNLKKGDLVTVEGIILDGPSAPSYSVTRIDSIKSLIISSSNNPLPEAQTIITDSIGTGDGVVEKEKWESVLIKYENVTVDSLNADGASNFGEMFVNDGSGQTRVELQDGNHKYHNVWDPILNSDSTLIAISKGDQFSQLRGILYFSFSNYKLVPRKDDDFVGYIPTGIESENMQPTHYSLSQNYPNPFNPATTISYSLPEAGFVTVKIFNILGQEVKTLINQYQNAGNYRVSFDASSLTSGVYFYSLSTDNFLQVKKMMLIK